MKRSTLRNKLYKYNCECCDREFFYSRKRIRKFCSKVCSNAYYTISFNCMQCGRLKTFHRSQLNKYSERGTFCSMTCLRKYYKEHPSNDTRYLSEHGYFINHGKTYEHRKKMMDFLGRDLALGEQIHHIDLDKTNNDVANLYLCPNQTEHNKLHWTLNRLVGVFLRDDLIIFQKGVYNLNEENYKKKLDKKT